MEKLQILWRYTLLLMLIVFTGLGAYAQDAGSKLQPGDDPVQNYVNANKESSLVQFYLAHPEDGNAAVAVKYAAILDNPALFPELDENAISRIKTEFEMAGKRITYISEQIKSGASYERANAMYERKAGSEPIQKNTANEIQSGEPAIMAVPNN